LSKLRKENRYRIFSCRKENVSTTRKQPIDLLTDCAIRLTKVSCKSEILCLGAWGAVLPSLLNLLPKVLPRFADIHLSVSGFQAADRITISWQLARMNATGGTAERRCLGAFLQLVTARYFSRPSDPRQAEFTSRVPRADNNADAPCTLARAIRHPLEHGIHAGCLGRSSRVKLPILIERGRDTVSRG